MHHPQPGGRTRGLGQSLLPRLMSPSARRPVRSDHTPIAKPMNADGTIIVVDAKNTKNIAFVKTKNYSVHSYVSDCTEREQLIIVISL